MPYDFKATRAKSTDFDTTFKRAEYWHMFGETGCPGLGSATKRGSWVGTGFAQWKSFFLRPQEQDGANAVTGAVVVIEGCFTKASGEGIDPDVDTDVFLIATLNNTTRYVSFEAPVGFVRARVTTAPTDTDVAIQVDMQSVSA